MEVYLIRHTRPQIKKGICYGQSDVPLVASFPSEARRLLKKLSSDIDIVYTSPVSRCMRLANLIPSEKLVVDERLRELHFGDWEMKEWNAISQMQLDRWMKNFVEIKVPGGESYLDLNKRVNDFITSLRQKSYKRVAVVTHAGVIRCFAANLLNMNLKDTFSLKYNYASITKIVYQGID